MVFPLPWKRVVSKKTGSRHKRGRRSASLVARLRSVAHRKHTLIGGNQPQLFLRDGNDVKVELAEFNHWSEPFGEGVTRVLCDAVSASLTPRKGLASPMRSQQPFQWRIAVDIARFDGAPNGSVILDAGWSLVNENGEELKSGRFVQHAPAGPDIPSMVQAQSALLAQFGAVLGQMIP